MLSFFPRHILSSVADHRSQSRPSALRPVGSLTDNPKKILEGHATFHGVIRSEREREQRDSLRRDEKRHLQQHDKRETHQANHRPLGPANSLPQPDRKVHDESNTTSYGSPSDRSSDVDGNSAGGAEILLEPIASPDEMSGHELGRR